MTKRKKAKICRIDKKKLSLQTVLHIDATMGNKIKKLKKIRIHREGTSTLLYGGIAVAVIATLSWFVFDSKIPFGVCLVVLGAAYAIVVNFYQCPIRYFSEDETDKIVVAPADGY